jgi:phosphoglycerate dehydrogenase-like enzyme
LKIAVSSPSFSKNEILKKEIRVFFPDTFLNENGKKLEEEELIHYIGDAEGAIIGLEKIDKNVLNKCNNLKIISKYGVGLDNIDVEYCAERKIHIGWTPGVNKLSVAEMTVSFMIILIRNLFSTSIKLKKGIWDKNGGFNLSGKTVGIIGAGNVGKEVIRLLKPFNCRILVNDIVGQSDYYKQNDLTETSKEEIFRTADFITLHVPLTNETQHMINLNIMQKMKHNAFLINTSRGPVVKSDDLKLALLNKIIAGAAIDVYNEEPPNDSKLINLPNLICTPHIGGNSYESVLAMGRSAIMHLRKYFAK